MSEPHRTIHHTIHSTILCVDDHDANRYVISRILREANFTVVEAATGQAALDLAPALCPDLVILDVQLPDINGFEICDRLRNDPKTASIPILNLSAEYTTSHDRVQGMNAGADGYLVQPVEPLELIATVQALLRLSDAERSAKQLADQWQITFDAINDGICLLNQDGIVIRCNRALTEFLNLDRLVGEPYKALAAPLAQLDGDLFDRLQDSKQRQTAEFLLNNCWISLRVDPILDQQEQFAGAVFLLSDITQRKRVEAERSLLLVREQEARERSESANCMKDEFLATISHELRSPLNSMLGWLTLLRTTSMTDLRRSQAMETIERNARSQAQLVEDLLDVSRIIQGKLRLNIHAIELPAVIQSAIETLRPAATAKNIALESTLNRNAGTIAGDPDRLQQVIWNLLSNAVKFTPSGGQVYIQLERIDSHVKISVRDTGMGIEPEFLPYVFDRFQQADGSMTRSYSGLGLGLAIARHIIELHGGTISADSLGEDQGATFTVHLPLAPNQPSVSKFAIPSIPLVSTNAELPCLAGISVLIVDDEEDARDYFVTLLQTCDAAVTAVSSSQAALEALLASKFDVLISDIGMPDEDGYDLIRKVRSQGMTIPAAALTAYARPEDRTKAIASGFQTHLPKPIEPLELATVVASLADRIAR